MKAPNCIKQSVGILDNRMHVSLETRPSLPTQVSIFGSYSYYWFNDFH